MLNLPSKLFVFFFKPRYSRLRLHGVGVGLLGEKKNDVLIFSVIDL